MGGLVAGILGPDEIIRERKEWYWISSRNIINYTFAYHGKLIFDFLFALVATLNWYLRLKQQHSLLPTNAQGDDRASCKGLIKNTVRQYLVKLALIYFILWLCFFLIDHIFIWTGGRCDVSDTFSAERCRTLHGKWEGGFDISGHFCFLTNLSLVLWQELNWLFESSNVSLITWNERCAFLQWLIVAVLIIWINVLVVTAVYYHTFLEKVLGCAFGYWCWIFLYIVIPRVNAFRSIFT